MCGIIGYVGKKDVIPIIVEGLKRLEYRGYDSAGIAVYTESGFDVAKQRGRLAALTESLKKRPLFGHMGIGHTRWATHGEPSDVNSHPHLGQMNHFAIVHNGIIENYKHHKSRLVKKGVSFVSETDSEVIAQLAEYYYNGDLLDTVIKTANALEGSFALGIMCADKPGTLIALKKDSPLIIGKAKDGNFIASDVPAVLEHTNYVYYMEDKEIAVLTEDSIQFYNYDKEPITKEITQIEWTHDSAQKGGYPHFMLKEIFEQPKVIKDTAARAFSDEYNAVMREVTGAGYERFVFVACGSAYYACVVAKYVFESMCRVPVEIEMASEFRYKDAIVDGKTLVIPVSQSGETADTIAAMREAKARGAKTLAVVNVIGSTIAKESDFCMLTAAGPEIAVATTKAFSAQLIILYMIAVKFAAAFKRITPERELELIDEINELSDKCVQILEQTDVIQKYAAECVGFKNIFFIGRNIDYAIALEGSHKLKEISYIHSEAYAGGELKHGTISLIEEGSLVVALSNVRRLYGKIMSNTEQVISRGAKVLFIGNAEELHNTDLLYIVSIPECYEMFSPSLSVIVLQLFAYFIAANKGLDIDKPRNLAKSVTVE